MSGFAVVEEPVEQLYTASLYYIHQTVSHWRVHLVVTHDTEPHLTVVRKYYESVNAVAGPHIPIVFEREVIELNIPMDGIVVNGWLIKPLIIPVLAQKRVDYFRPGQKIPCFQLIAEFPQQGAAAPIPELYHLLPITGAKEPDNMITIEIDPAWPLCGSNTGLRDIWLPGTRAVENRCNPLTLEILKSKAGVTEDQLNREIEERDFLTIAGYFDNVDDYLYKLRLAPGQQADVKDVVHRQGVRAGVDKALRCWRQPNPYDATFRALLVILLELKKGNVAVQVCKYLVNSGSAVSTLEELMVQTGAKDEDLDRTIPDAHLDIIALKFSNFVALAEALKLKSYQITSIQTNVHLDYGMKLKRVLHMWKGCFITRAKYRFLANLCLTTLGLGDVAETICELSKGSDGAQLPTPSDVPPTDTQSQQEHTESKKIYDDAMEAGYVTMKTKNVLLFGMAGTGKTSTKHIVLGLSPPKNRDSTPLASTPERVHVRDISGEKFLVEQDEWKPVTVDDYQQIVADIVQSHAGNLEEVPKQLATALEKLQPPSNVNPHDESDFVENPERVDQDQVASTVADDHVQDQNAKEGLKSDEIRTLITNIAGEIKVHVGRLIDAKASGRKLQKILGLNWVYFIDSGGQPHFYNLLPLFVDGISAALYILRLSEGLNEHPRVEYYKDGKPLGGSYDSPLTTAANFKYLVRSIQSRSSNLQLVCIGTHLDKVEECSETVKQKNDRLLELLPESIRANVLFSNIAQHEVIFPIDARNLGPPQKEMAKKLQEVILGCPSSDFDVPIWWFTFEIIIEKITSKLSRKVLSKAQCVDVAHRLNFHENALIEALKFFHKHHIFHYYPDILPDVVFCSTQVIMDKITELVEYASLLRDLSSTESKSGKWLAFRDRGIVTIEFLNEFEQQYVDGIFEPTNLIEIFKHLLIITPLSDTPSDKTEYFMPAILDVLPTSELEKLRIMITSSEVAPLLVQFANCWPRCGVFCCLQVYLVQHCGWHFGKRLQSNPPKQNVVKLHPDIGCSVTLIDSLTYIEVHVQAPSPILASICPCIRDDVECGTKAACKALHYKDSDLQLAFFCPRDCKSLLDDTSKPPAEKHAKVSPSEESKPEPHTAVVQWEYKFMCCSEDEDNCSPLEDKHKIWWGQASSPAVTELTLHNLTVELDKLMDPFQFGVHLKIPQNDITQIEKAYLNPTDIDGQKKELFKYIASNHKTLNITWATIADALSKIKHGDLSLKIREKYRT